MTPESSASTSDFRPGDSWLIGVVLAVLTFWLFAQTMLNVIPDIRASLGLQPSTADLAVTLTALFAGIFIVVAGGIGDRIGQTIVFRVGVVLSIVGSLLLVLTPADTGVLTAGMLLLGRVIQGLSIACIMPSSLSMINTLFAGEQRQRAVSFFSLGTFGGLGVASLTGGLISGFLGWRSIFIASIVAAVIALFLTRHTPPLRPEPSATARASFDVPGMLAFLVSMVALNVYIAEGRRLGWASGAGLAVAAVAILAFVVFVLIALRRGRGAFVDLGMFRNRYFTGPVLANFLMNSTAAVIIVTLGLVQRGLGWSSTQAGLLTIGHLAMVVIFIRIGERLLQRDGARRPMVLGTISVLVGVLLTTSTYLPVTLYLVAAVLGLALFGLGQGMFATPAIDAAITAVPASEVGVASGILKMGSTLGQALGVALAVAAVAAGASGLGGTQQIWKAGGWPAGAAADRVGTMVGSGLLVIIAIVMVTAVIVTVPRDNDPTSVASDEQTTA